MRIRLFDTPLAQDPRVADRLADAGCAVMAPGAVLPLRTANDDAACDVILCDLDAPEKDGRQVCMEFADADSLDPAAVVLLVSAADRDRRAEAFDAGADDCLVVPDDLDDLAWRLRLAARAASYRASLSRREAEIDWLAHTLAEDQRRDPVTGLMNRRQLRHDLLGHQARVERYAHTYCIALLEIADFDALQEEAGVDASDDLLRDVASVLQIQARSGDSLYRFSASAFAVIFPEQASSGAQIGIQRMLAAASELERPVPAGRPPANVRLRYHITMVGLSTWAPVDELLSRAERELAEAGGAAPAPVALDATPL